MSDDASNLNVYVAHRAALVDYAAPIVGCRARAEDVVQEAYFRFVRQAPDAAVGARMVDQPVGYLYRIVRNLAFDWLRSLGADQRRHEAHHVLVGDGIAVPSPEDLALEQDALRQVEGALATMPDRMRQAFELHRIGGKTLQQIADTLGVSVATAHRLVRDASVSIMRHLENTEIL